MNDRIKQKIIELVFPTSKESEGQMAARMQNPITLADVLRAIRDIELPIAKAMTTAPWDKMEKDLLKIWDLTEDYDHQTQEVKDFIGKLLGV